jgi:hypothetical protein
MAYNQYINDQLAIADRLDSFSRGIDIGSGGSMFGNIKAIEAAVPGQIQVGKLLGMMAQGRTSTQIRDDVSRDQERIRRDEQFAAFTDYITGAEDPIAAAEEFRTRVRPDSLDNIRIEAAQRALQGATGSTTDAFIKSKKQESELSDLDAKKETSAIALERARMAADIFRSNKDKIRETEERKIGLDARKVKQENMQADIAEEQLGLAISVLDETRDARRDALVLSATNQADSYWNTMKSNRLASKKIDSEESIWDATKEEQETLAIQQKRKELDDFNRAQRLQGIEDRVAVGQSILGLSHNGFLRDDKAKKLHYIVSEASRRPEFSEAAPELTSMLNGLSRFNQIANYSNEFATLYPEVMGAINKGEFEIDPATGMPTDDTMKKVRPDLKSSGDREAVKRKMMNDHGREISRYHSLIKAKAETSDALGMDGGLLDQLTEAVESGDVNRYRRLISDIAFESTKMNQAIDSRVSQIKLQLDNREWNQKIKEFNFDVTKQGWKEGLEAKEIEILTAKANMALKNQAITGKWIDETISSYAKEGLTGKDLQKALDEAIDLKIKMGLADGTVQQIVPFDRRGLGVTGQGVSSLGVSGRGSDGPFSRAAQEDAKRRGNSIPSDIE